MARDLVLSTPKRQSVRRCLFGHPDRDDEFRRTRIEMDAAAALRFKRKWNFDVLNDEECSGNRNGEFQWKSSSESDIPDFYSRGYTHKCKRRAVRPCVGKSLSFMGDSDDESSCLQSRVRSQSPLPFFYDAASFVDVFLGMRMPSPQEPVTPTPTERRSTQTTPSTDNDSALSDISDFSPVPSTMQRSLSQTRLTDMWPIKKRRRSVSSDQRPSKRGRMDSL
ncbi:hypothetical protein V1264_015666 [Littorina saxatilis]|uniref:Cyclin-dependent kinase inhibitor domain-containing protein n=1 Tax=Littorina saxatilis TaxID=31220 RepID=A0AAN9BQH9_9CAEN